MPRNNLPQRLLCAAVLAAISLQPALAEKRSSTSRVRPLSCPEPVAAPEPVSSFTPEMAGDGRVHVFADQVEATLDEWAIFRGHVELLHGELQLRGDEVRYNQTDNTLSAHGQVELSKAGNDTVRAPVLRYELDTERGDSENAEFMLGNNDMGRGWAKRMTMAGRDRMTLESVRYTTCPPGQDDWFLRARELTLDKTSEIGTAWHAVVEFQHVPIFYSPYLSFPLTDERKTGFLTPRMGHGSSSGFMLATPYYFNLAPNYDDTLTPRVLSERGLQLSNEFRYLGESYRGNLELEYLPNDRKTDTDRQALAFQHNHRLSPGWSARSDIQWVSDNSYFIDLGNNASVASRTHLPRYLRTDYQGSIWQFTARVSNFQTLDSTITLSDLPYQRLPQLLLRADSPSGPNQLRYTLESEWVNFYRPGFAPDTAGVIEPPVSGQRFDVLPGISLPLRTSYFYFTPKAAYRYTSWKLGRNADADNVNPDESPTRGLPVYSLDSGLALEREGRIGGQAYAQTLEPRIYYVYIPYKNQDSLPVFDTALPDFSFFNFFRENRFVGADRVGDANQLTAAITSRFLNPDTGIEQARLSLGQVQYFEDQRVNLPSGTVTQTSSDLIAEVFARLGNPWYLRGGAQWDNEARETRKASAYLHYHPAPDRIVNLGYRFLNTTTTPMEEQIDISSAWPLGRRWAGIARWNFSIPDSRTVQAYAGLEYTSCCWAVRAVWRHRYQLDGSVDNNVQLELQLSGLTRDKQAQDDPLQQGRFIFDNKAPAAGRP